MTNKCCVPQCRGNYNRNNKAHVFKFPKDDELRKKWVNSISRDQFKPSKNSVICHKHFPKSDIVFESFATDWRTGKVIKVSLRLPKLKPGVVPSLMLGDTRKEENGLPKVFKNCVETANMDFDQSNSIAEVNVVIKSEIKEEPEFLETEDYTFTESGTEYGGLEDPLAPELNNGNIKGENKEIEKQHFILADLLGTESNMTIKSEPEIKEEPIEVIPEDTTNIIEFCVGPIFGQKSENSTLFWCNNGNCSYVTNNYNSFYKHCLTESKAYWTGACNKCQLNFRPRHLSGSALMIAALEHLVEHLNNLNRTIASGIDIFPKTKNPSCQNSLLKSILKAPVVGIAQNLEPSIQNSPLENLDTNSNRNAVATTSSHNADLNQQSPSGSTKVIKINVKASQLALVCKPYICSAARCMSKYYIQDNFVKHLRHYHNVMSWYNCKICDLTCCTIMELILHYYEHKIGFIQCLLCLFTSDKEKVIREHLAQCHRNQVPLALYRRPNPELVPSCEKLSEPALPEVILPKLHICQLLPQAKINSIPNQFVNKPRVENTESIPEKRLKKVSQLNKYDPETLKSYPAKKNPGPIEVTELKDILHTGLWRRQLYICGSEGCGFSADYITDFKMHYSVCKMRREEDEFTCFHCKISFSKLYSLITHIDRHGITRFGCSLCNYRGSVVTNVTAHMRDIHKKMPTRLVPLNPLKCNEEKDLFVIVTEDLSGEPSDSSSLMFTPLQIELIPAESIPKKRLKCGVCSYRTTVRVYLINHLTFHLVHNVHETESTITTSATSSVPSTGKSNAEICKAYYDRKKAAMNDEIKKQGFISLKKKIRKTPAERMVAYRKRKKMRTLMMPSTSNLKKKSIQLSSLLATSGPSFTHPNELEDDFKMRKTNAEHCKNYYNRKKAAKEAEKTRQGLSVNKPIRQGLSVNKPIRKTAAERNRAYRLRKKMLSQVDESSVAEILSTPSTSSSRIRTFAPSFRLATISASTNQPDVSTLNKCNPSHWEISSSTTTHPELERKPGAFLENDIIVIDDADLEQGFSYYGTQPQNDDSKITTTITLGGTEMTVNLKNLERLIPIFPVVEIRDLKDGV